VIKRKIGVWCYRLMRVTDRYHVPAPQAGFVPTADSTLINGKGRYAGGPTSPLAAIRVLKGIKYRFRLVSISCDPNYTFSIDGHTMVGHPCAQF
jgi:iron transport multicopper oxidase